MSAKQNKKCLINPNPIQDGMARIKFTGIDLIVEIPDSLTIIKKELDKYIPGKCYSALVEANGFKLCVDILDIQQYKEYRLISKQR